jgi:hypothetical protein
MENTEEKDSIDNSEKPKENTEFSANLEYEKVEEPQEKSNFFRWLFEHKTPVTFGALVLILICTIAFYQIRLSTVESEFIVEKNNYEQQTAISYQIKMDSVNLDNAYRLSKVFSWSVRAELLRGNQEQVNILFGQFIKTPGIAKVSLIDPETNKIILATDRKMEGEIFPDISILKNSETIIIDNRLSIAISGLNDVIGYLFYEFDNLPKKPQKDPGLK